MNLGYNLSFTIAAVIIGIVLFLIVAINYSSTNLVNRRFRYFLIASLVMYVLNIATVITNCIAKDLPHWFNVLFNSLYFLSTVVVSLLFFYYCASFARRGNPLLRAHRGRLRLLRRDDERSKLPPLLGR